jgi:hypothetical protein
MARRVWVPRRLKGQSTDLRPFFRISVVLGSDQPIGGNLATLHDMLALRVQRIDIPFSIRQLDQLGFRALLVELLRVLADALKAFDPANRLLVGILKGAGPAL